jgi:hypothetical protein
MRRHDTAPLGDSVREMEAADWASLSERVESGADLLERRIAKLGLRFRTKN